MRPSDRNLARDALPHCHAKTSLPCIDREDGGGVRPHAAFYRSATLGLEVRQLLSGHREVDIVRDIVLCTI